MRKKISELILVAVLNYLLIVILIVFGMLILSGGVVELIEFMDEIGYFVYVVLFVAVGLVTAVIYEGNMLSKIFRKIFSILFYLCIVIFILNLVQGLSCDGLDCLGSFMAYIIFSPVFVIVAVFYSFSLWVRGSSKNNIALIRYFVLLIKYVGISFILIYVPIILKLLF